jgi:hypothetical protein
VAFDSQDCCFVGRGKAFISPWENTALSWGYNWGISWGQAVGAGGTAGRFLGNVTSLNFQVDSQTIEQIGRSGFFPSESCGATIINGVNFSITLNCLSLDNLNFGLFGKKTDHAATSTTKTQYILPNTSGVFQAGSFFPYNETGGNASSVTIQRTDTMNFLVSGIDYTASETGVTILNSIVVPLNTALLLSYSNSYNYSCINPITTSQGPVTIVFDGLNLANVNERYKVTFFRARLRPLSALELISDSFQTITLNGILEPDPCKDGKDHSQYFEICKFTVL